MVAEVISLRVGFKLQWVMEQKVIYYSENVCCMSLEDIKLLMEHKFRKRIQVGQSHSKIFKIFFH